MPPKSGRNASPPGGSKRDKFDSNLSASKGGLARRGSGTWGTGGSSQQDALDPEEEAARQAMALEHTRQRSTLESEESLNRQRHEALESVARKFITTEWLKHSNPMAYYKQTKPSQSHEAAQHKCTVKLMTCNRAMKPFAIPVPLPECDSELDALTLAEFKERIFEAAKTSFVDPVMLPLLVPQMQVLYNLAGKQVGRVEDRAAMDRWLAAHPPPTKKLSAAERAALPPPPPMPTIESPTACVRQFDVVPGSTVYLAIRVAAPDVVGSDPQESAVDMGTIVIPPVNPKDFGKSGKKAQAAAAAASASSTQQAAAATATSGNAGGASPGSPTSGGGSPGRGRR